MDKTQVGVNVVVSVLAAFCTVLATSNDLLDGVLNRDKVKLEIEKLRSDIANYEEISQANIEKVQADTELAVLNIKSETERLKPQIENLEIDTQVMQSSLRFDNLANDLTIVRGLRPLVDSKGRKVQKFTFDGNKEVMNVDLSITNTGGQPVRINEFSSTLICDGAEKSKTEYTDSASVASGTTFEFDPPEMAIPNDCGKCKMRITFLTEADPISMHLLETRYPEILTEFRDFFHLHNNYNFSC